MKEEERPITPSRPSTGLLTRKARAGRHGVGCSCSVIGHKKRHRSVKARQGQFEAIDSFAIKRRHEFYLIGRLTEGAVQVGWFINVRFNSSLAMTIRITAIEDVELASERTKYKLLIVQGDDEAIELLLALKIGSELMDITIEGED